MLLKNNLVYRLGIIIIILLVVSCTNFPTTPQQTCAVADPKLQGHYQGDCQNGKAHGSGMAIGKDKYEGEFVQGLPQGKGTYTWADGESFVGSFDKGIPQIPHSGCYVADPRLRGRYQGTCLNAKAHGRGKATGIDIYEGEFSNGLTDGQGTYVWSNGDRYIGQFKAGQANGRGVMKYGDGKEEAGLWQNNKLVN
jgi:hypothetical protein